MMHCVVNIGGFVLKRFLVLVLALSSVSAIAGKNDAASNIYKYKTDSCAKKGEAQVVKDPYYHCKDGSISFKQPSSTGYKGYEGKCGQTAASNIMYFYCDLITSPSNYTNAYLSDYTPGVRPDTFEEGINEMFRDETSCPYGSWTFYNNSDHRIDYLDSLYYGLKDNAVLTRTRSDGTRIKRGPIPVLIEIPPRRSGIFHWVTVVDIEGYNPKQWQNYSTEACKVIINHWGAQYSVPCEVFTSWSYNTDLTTAGYATGNYVRLKFKKSKSFAEWLAELNEARAAAEEMGEKVGKKVQQRVNKEKGSWWLESQD